MNEPTKEAIDQLRMVEEATRIGITAIVLKDKTIDSLKEQNALLEEEVSRLKDVLKDESEMFTRMAYTIYDLEKKIDQFKEGYEGCCTTCEPVGALNVKLTAEVERLTKIVSEMKRLLDEGEEP